MAKDKKKWYVRVLYDFPVKNNESICEFDNYDGAKSKFIFYVNSCLEFPELSIRCINLIHGNYCIKYFHNFSFRSCFKFAKK